ncbi:MAG: hypothetical protein KQH83_08535 [Actinobacteria bacterium]|nr:hypothetical protein [Actinomycetota bacterium]
MRRTVAFLLTAAVLTACGESTLQTADTTAPPSTASTTMPVETTATTAAPATTTTAAPTTTATTTAPPTTTTTAAPTTTTTTLPPSGPASADCIDGWITPAEGSPEWVDGLSYLGIAPGRPIEPDDFVVEVMRYCVGPEDANIIAPRRDVERWYIKGHATNDPSFQGRWLARRVDVGAGLAWVAPYASTGFGPGVWEDCYDSDRTGMVAGDFCSPGAGWDPMANSCLGIAPGTWTPGDCSGLPPEVLGCFAGA